MWPALISAGANILGGMLSSNSQKEANEANLEMANRNLQFQQDAAKSGVSWKAADARNAEAQYGINPLVSMGASTFSPSPVSAGAVGSDALGSGISKAGQDIARAAQAYAPEVVRKQKLEADLLEAQIGQVKADTVRSMAAASNAARQAPTNPTPLYQTFVDPWGKRTVLPSDKAASPMQTITAWPSNLAIGAQMLYHNLMNDWPSKMGGPASRGDVHRAHNPTRLYIDVPNR